MEFRFLLGVTALLFSSSAEAASTTSVLATYRSDMEKAFKLFESNSYKFVPLLEKCFPSGGGPSLAEYKDLSRQLAKKKKKAVDDVLAGINASYLPPKAELINVADIDQGSRKAVAGIYCDKIVDLAQPIEAGRQHTRELAAIAFKFSAKFTNVPEARKEPSSKLCPDYNKLAKAALSHEADNGLSRLIATQREAVDALVERSAGMEKSMAATGFKLNPKKNCE
jgi:hypothetical protein